MSRLIRHDTRSRSWSVSLGMASLGPERDLGCVRSTQGAVLAFWPIRFLGPPPEPGVPVVPAPGSPQVPVRVAVVGSSRGRPWGGNCGSPVAIACGAHRVRVEQRDFRCAATFDDHSCPGTTRRAQVRTLHRVSEPRRATIAVGGHAL